MDTIHAVSSGSLPAGVGVVRVSGPACRFILETTIGRIPPPRRAVLRSIRDRNGLLVDRGLVLWMPGPESFTGEDTIEFHVHGSRAVVRALARHLDGFDGVRAAEPGEFTRRAFLAGRIDLTEAEGLADLLAAETEAQRRQALDQAEGGLRRLYQSWRDRLVRIRALVEADFDFAEEEDVPGSVADEAWADAGRLRSEIAAHLADGHRGERLRRGFQVVVLGRPNAGKSSLLNALARRDAAIVTDEPGTTRDPIEVHLDLEGWPVTVVDTAGLREATGKVEAEGIRRAVERIAGADLVLWTRPCDDPGDDAAVPYLGGAALWEVRTKADLGAFAGERLAGATAVYDVSVANGSGVAGRGSALAAAAGGALCGVGAAPTRERHRSLLERASGEVVRALRPGSGEAGMRAEDLRRAGEAIGRVTGAIGVEDLLDVVFREFCIGK